MAITNYKKGILQKHSYKKTGNVHFGKCTHIIHMKP